jgi:transposase InsO family protein
VAPANDSQVPKQTIDIEDSRKRREMDQDRAETTDRVEVRNVNVTPHDRVCSMAIPVCLGSYQTNAIIDTAAHKTVISQQLYDKISHELPVPSAAVRLSGPEIGSSMRGLQIRDVKLRIEGTQYNCDLVVGPISDDLLLGFDFLEANQATIDLPRCLLQLGPQKKVAATMIRMEGRQGVQIARVVVAKKVVAPPNSLVQVPVKLQSTSKQDFVIEGLTVPNNPLMSAGIVKGGSTTVVTFLNDSNHYFTLKKGHECGVAVELDKVVSEQDWTNKETSEKDEIKLRLLSEEVQDQLNQERTLPEHVQGVYQQATENLDSAEKMAVRELLAEYSDVFSKHEFDLGKFDKLQHEITLHSDQPFRKRMRRTPLCFEKEEEKTLQHMMEAGVIQPSASEWASAPVLVRKKDGSLRYCIDYRTLNDRTVKDAFPLPLIEECLDSLRGSAFFSSLDMASGYWQIPIKPEDQPKTAFITKYGLYEHVRMGFGLCNAPATFSRAMGLVLKGLTYKQVLAYLDDVVIVGKSFSDHLVNLKTVLQRFREHNLKLKPRKCHLFQRDIDFLGRHVSNKGVSVQESKIKTIVEWPRPQNKGELSSFLGTVNYHREFIPKFAEVSSPLYDLTGKHRDFTWNDEHEASFESLKRSLISAPVLGYPNDVDTFVLDCDASGTAIGAELIQVQDGKEVVIGYSSYSLTPLQRRYCTTRQELLALVTFTRHFRHYLLGRKFMVRTDHASLTWLTRFRYLEGQLARWCEELAQYDMTIIHRSGKLHQNADGLSRIPDKFEYCDCYEAGKSLASLPCGGCNFCNRCHQQWVRFEEDVDYVTPIAVRRIETEPEPPDTAEVTEITKYTPAQMRELQLKDPDLAPVMAWLETREPTQQELFSESPATKHLWNLKDQLRLNSGVLYYCWDYVTHSKLKLLVPEALKPEVLSMMHDTKAGGHFGRDKTTHKVQDRFFWVGLKRDVALYVRTCGVCGVNKKPSKTPRAPLEKFQSGAPFERVHLDILGPFRESTKGNRYVLMIVDQFSKWVACVPLPDQSAETMATAFYEHIVAIFGCPHEVHTDQGRNFDGNYFQALCSLLEIVKTRTTPYRPSANGQVERYNRVVLQFIRCFLGDKQQEWDKHLAAVGMSIRASVHQGTGFTPNFLVFGREVTMPSDILFNLPSIHQPHSPPAQYAMRTIERLKDAFHIVRENLKVTQCKQKRQYDKRVESRTYHVGDIVYKRNSATSVGQSKKLLPVFKGPYVVTAVISPILYRVESQKATSVEHHDRLAPCTDRHIPLWVQRKRAAIWKTDPEESNQPPTEEEREEEEDEFSVTLGTLFDAAPEDPEIPVATTRNGRAVKLPMHLRDYDMTH